MRDKASVSLRLLLATLFVLWVCSGDALAATEKILHSFNGMPHGGGPESVLVSDASGNLYGTALGGGVYAMGTVFKLAPNSNGGWTQTVLYSFKGGSDGANPAASVVFDALGNLYGTTEYGGTGPCGTSYYAGCGTVFKLSPSSGGGWTESVLYTFQSGSDGVQPEDSLVLDSAGNLYGTTLGGGISRYGTVFKLTPSAGGTWTETILYSFIGSSDGGTPYASLVFDTAGNLYGTASKGGALTNGVVFELTPAQGTWTEKTLYNFGGTDGSSPEAAVIFDSAGNLYGTTRNGGAIGCGAVFELQPNGNSSWSESVLYSFASTGGDGCNPVAGVTFDGAAISTGRHSSVVGGAAWSSNSRPVRAESGQRTSFTHSRRVTTWGILMAD